MIQAKVVCDSVGQHGIRLTTFSLIYPRWILAELNTHRVFSRNSASSRAIPVKKIIQAVQDNPAVPVFWGKNQPGMQADELLSPEQQLQALQHWIAARDAVLPHVQAMLDIGLHKQTANRALEPWMHAQTIVSATEWDNFFNLRRHPAAQPEFRQLAVAMAGAMQASTPRNLQAGDWHLPYADLAKAELPVALQCSVARCARVSYLTHESTVPSEDKDIATHDRLLANGHMSPFEHQAMCCEDSELHGNFRGFKQYRKFIPNEHDKLNEFLT
jgi:thymidylate synthase ThyX